MQPSTVDFAFDSLCGVVERVGLPRRRARSYPQRCFHYEVLYVKVNLRRRRQILTLACARAAFPLAGWAGSGLALAQAFPARPVHLIVPFPAGGPADTIGRVLALKLGEALRQTVVVDNRPGAGGMVGADAAAKAAPDGYTLLLGNSSTHSILPVLNARTPYRIEADFTPVAAVASAPALVLVPASSPARTLREFIELARRAPGRLNYGSSGIGTIVHLGTEYFKAETGTFIVHIPYAGTAPAMADLIAGRIDLRFDSVVTGLPQVRDGKVRALAVTSLEASPLAPGIPPVAEQVPGYEGATWFGVFGPRGLPADVTARLNQAINAALADPALKARLAQLGAQPTGGEPAALAERMRADAAQWKRIADTRGIRLD